MKKIFLLGLLLAGLIVPAYPQATSHTAFRFQQGSVKPATPAVGDVWTDTSTSPAVDYVCLTAGAWTALSTGSGSGTPGGVSGNIQAKDIGGSGNFAGITGTTYDNNPTFLAQNSVVLAASRTWTNADNTHSGHVFEPTAKLTGAGIGNTLAALYATAVYAGSGGLLHGGASMHRGTDSGTGGTVTAYDLNYSDFNSSGTPATLVSPYTKLVFYNAVGGSLNGGVGNTFTQICGFCWSGMTVAGNTLVSLELGGSFGVPALADTRKTSAIGVSIGGGADTNNYDALVVDSGMSYFKQGIKQSLTLDSTLFAAPITTGGVPVSGIVAGIYQSNFPTGAQSAANMNSLLTAPNGITGSLYGNRQIVDNGGNGLVALLNPFYGKCNNSGAATTTECDVLQIDTPANAGTIGTTRGVYVKTQANGAQTNTPIAIETAGAADLVKLAGPTITNGGHGISLTSQTTITAGAAVKIDTANNSSAVLCAITDTTGCTGFAQNAATAGQTVFVLTTGNIATPVLGTGTCTKGQFVINDSTTAGRVKCTSTYTAGTVLGWATIAQASVGSAVGVDIQVR